MGGLHGLGTNTVIEGKDAALDRWDWLLVVAAVVLGQFALLAIELVRGQLERWQRRRDRRDDAERDALTELQESVYDMIRAATVMISHREALFADTGEWRIKLKYTDPEPDAFVTAYARAGVLAVRVRDEPIRICVEALREVVDAAISAKDPDTGSAEWATVTDVLDDTNERIGERLRTL
jgi:hypothetical protein